MTEYQSVDKDIWKGRIDDLKNRLAFRIHQVVEFIDLQNSLSFPLISQQGICFIGFKCDEGIRLNLGRTGAAKAPDSIRSQLANLPVYFNEKFRIFDAGNVTCDENELEKAQWLLSEKIEIILGMNLFPVVLGGGHEVALGNFKAIYNHIKESNQTPGIINFDAHFDLRPYSVSTSSGSMFLQIADFLKTNNKSISYFVAGIQRHANTLELFNTAKRLNVEYLLATEMKSMEISGILDLLYQFLEKHEFIHLTLCADVFSSAYAPGVSAPQPFGLHPEIIIQVIKHIVKSKKVVSFDIGEVSPRFDDDNITSKLIAVIVFAVINVLSESTEEI